MATKLSRRDFLKLSSALAGSMTLGRLIPTANGNAERRPNVLLLVFDTMSALHLSVYGYERETTPNLSRFAEKAFVYHAHYAESCFTTPSTASILTGALPWTHRAVNASGLIRRDFVSHNLFRMAGETYFKLGFSQNLWADLFLRQFYPNVDLRLPPSSFAYANPLLLGESAPSDPLPYFAYDDFLVGGVKLDTPYPGSILLGTLDAVAGQDWNIPPDLQESQVHPPFNGYFYYWNRTVFRGLQETLQKVSSNQERPWLAYIHLWSPHEPYASRLKFKEKFAAELKIPPKPTHPLIVSPFREQELRKYRRFYDRYIADVDDEFGAFLNFMDTAGLLDNTYIFVTSDHGQLFERGVHGHASRLMYEGVIRVPLLISAPGQSRRVDVRAPTANVDLLPTLAALMGVSPLPHLDGRPLPGLGGETDANRLIFSMRNDENSSFRPLRRGSFVAIEGTHKFIWYAEYPGYDDIFELYDLSEDPYELHNLSSANPNTVKRMKDILLAARQAAEEDLSG